VTGIGETAERVEYDLETYDGFVKAALLPAAYGLVERPDLEGVIVPLFHILCAKGVEGPYSPQSGVGAENEEKLYAEVDRIRRGLGRTEHPTLNRWVSMATEARWDGRSAHGNSDSTSVPSGSVQGIRALPFRALDPKTIPPRQPILRHYFRKFVSATVAPGGVGKSSLAIVEAISIATGRDLLGIKPRHRLKVWIWNGEDPLEELQRRVLAVCLEYKIDPPELEGWLFLNSGRDMEIVIAAQVRDGVSVNQNAIDQVKRTIVENEIALVIIDPFVSSHRVPENDNNAIDRVVKAWAGIADQTSCAVELVHHARKTYGNEVTVEDGRGASALLGAVRSARVLNPMSRDEAAKIGIDSRREYIRVENGKANLAPPSDKADWLRLKSVDLGNSTPDYASDFVGVAVRWKWPDQVAGLTAADFAAIQQAVGNGTWRSNPQAGDWVGRAIADVLGLDLTQGANKARVREIQRQMFERRLLREVQRPDAKRTLRAFVEVGTPAGP
jgi:hypothetical protein